MTNGHHLVILRHRTGFGDGVLFHSGDARAASPLDTSVGLYRDVLGGTPDWHDRQIKKAFWPLRASPRAAVLVHPAP